MRDAGAARRRYRAIGATQRQHVLSVEANSGTTLATTGEGLDVATDLFIYLSPVGDLDGGSCASLGRQLLSAGGDEPAWGAAAVGPPGPSPTLPVCPVGRPGTPPA